MTLFATTGLADSDVTSFDATTPPKPSSLNPSICNQLLVDLTAQVKAIQSNASFDLEATMAFQRAANYL